ncbi:hypothetical protein L1276_003727 [Flavobacterium sp. HSC-32F16]|uniref:hypothetical protein n=1 Tax=Flavobacterium sp. HSC-32F16 TaxID=2910964 RepID=UPI0020A58C23|nr:hypothetical protein [Flavobacterium sp. HSC-32F16]MCP2028557.1 hypothetical protein [Flavobacterium sp. HSC-32F16]
MKKIILQLILVFLFLQSCAQNNQNVNQNMTKLIDNLKKYDFEPIYQIKVKSNLSYTIAINGIPILNKYEADLFFSGNNINNCIPKSGIQKIDIKLFPPMKENGKFEDYIGNNSFELTIEQTAWNSNGALDKVKNISTYILPKIDLSNSKSYSYSYDFEANVPYNLIDWEEGEKFNIKDSLIIKEKVIHFYEKLKYYFENKEGENYSNSLDKGLFNIYQASYYTKKDALENYNNKIKFINNEKISLSSFENYKIQILGNNNNLISLKRIDGYNTGEGVLRRNYIKNKVEKVQIDDIILYKPKGSKDFEVIWYMNYMKGASM